MFRRGFSALLLSTSVLGGAPALAQTEPATGVGSDEIIVTAQKRNESIQDVPISIQALSTQKLDELNVASFTDFAALLPSVSFQNSAPGVANVYVRGVASGGDGNHSGSLPSVGIYLDEQPVTTIGGSVDINIYDIARIESLAGPQGTLYGASSQAGTIRIITNKPDSSGFYGRWDAEANTVNDGEAGGSLQGMVNIPINERAALRLVGWARRDGGYIDNVAGTRSFLPSPGGITVNNARFVEDDFNDVETYGGRAALKVDLNDNWTATGSLIGQTQETTGVFGFDASVGDLKVQHFYPDEGSDDFYQAGLTIQGKVANFDITYAGAYLERTVETLSDYSDYAEAYDQLYSSYGGLAGYFYFVDALGATIDPRQFIVGGSDFTKESHEFRVSSPSDQRLRFVVGAFYQQQTHAISQDYRVPNLAANMSVNGLPGTLWLTKQDRVDEDKALFGEATLDITEQLSVTAGIRAFEYENSLIGFFGFGRDLAGPPYNAAGSSRTGVAGCYTTTGQILRDNPGGTLLPAAVAGGPCTNLATFNANGTLSPKVASGDGTTYRFNVTYDLTPDVMFYATASSGFRPGGINRRATTGAYDSDELKNVEFGWKTMLFDRALRWNGAIYEQKWEQFQFSFLGLNSFTEIHNGPDATIRGLESDISWSPTANFTLNASGAYTDAKTDNNLCSVADPTFTCAASSILAPSGTRLPITPKTKLSMSGRYEWAVGDYQPYAQLVVSHRGSASTDIRTAEAAALGRLPSATTMDLAVGSVWKDWMAEVFVSNLTDERAQQTRYSQCSVCSTVRSYAVVETPRTIGIRFGSKF
ncbi:MAG: TonB-dependent receptor [Alphaproteobacteria bacterium]|nr:MAG: TonB-dependent receptor [Caulobacteraceae bacterium]TPW06512.1 MAG: TonB-dependent receptor [Alphaproteobacteria bacterium]